MPTFKVYEVEDKATQTGKKLKKLVLQDPNGQYPEKNVTMWSDHPEFNTVKAGGEVKGVLEKKDSGTPIPAHPNKNYINRTLLPEGTTGTQAPQGTPYNAGNIEARVKALEDWRKTFAGQEPTVQTEAPKEDINPDDIPFN